MRRASAALSIARPLGYHTLAAAGRCRQPSQRSTYRAASAQTLQVAQLSQPSFISDGAALRQFVTLLLNPLLLEPQYHKQILLPLLSLVAALPPPCADRLVYCAREGPMPMTMGICVRRSTRRL